MSRAEYMRNYRAGKKVETNVGPDQQDRAKELVKEHIQKIVEKTHPVKEVKDNVGQLLRRIAEQEDEIRFLKKELAQRPVKATVNTYVQPQRSEFRPYSKETQAGKKK